MKIQTFLYICFLYKIGENRLNFSAKIQSRFFHEFSQNPIFEKKTSQIDKILWILVPKTLAPSIFEFSGRVFEL